ncbi:MAG TPA: gp58-like family protein, partial [Candidatus Limosilactobacillus intestinipullorum]|nr:gp58-like family protein [Candidatus Limosilactobacillus intestinipullorum]
PLVGMKDVDKGSTLILTFDYVASADTKLTPQLDGDPWVPWGTIVNATPAAKGKKGSYSMTITVNDDSWQKGNAKNFCIRCDGFKGTIEITNLVLKYADTTLHDVQSSFDMLRDDINLRVTKGKLISQINLEAGRTLIQSSKIFLDADSVVFGGTAFIPSAAIVDIAADKITSGTLDAGNIRVINLTADNIHGGTLDVGNMHVKNFSADDIVSGTLRGINLVAGDDENQFGIKGSTIIWHSKATNSNGDPAVAQIGADKFLDFDPTNHSHAYRTLFEFISNDDIVIGTNVASYDKNRDEIDMETYGHGPNITINTPHKAPIYDELQGITLSSGDTNMSVMSSLNGLQSQIEFNTKNRIDFNLHPLADGDVNGSTFNIQKDNCVGAYFGLGNKGDEVWINAVGGTNIQNQLTVDSLNVKGYKHAIVKTSQGYVGINAYETAEYYFGDIGEANTGNAGEVIIGIDKIFNETVNTKIQYQVFITPYSDCHIWVETRYDNRFVVKSDQPNAKFGWELKAKRKGYESDRLRHIDGIKEEEEIKL